jgi:hypothetical protein
MIRRLQQISDGSNEDVDNKASETVCSNISSGKTCRKNRMILGKETEKFLASSACKYNHDLANVFRSRVWLADDD